MAVFLTVFYFSVGLSVERQVVKDDARLLVQSLARDVPLLPVEAQASLRQTLAGLAQAPTSPTAADAAVDASNAELVRTAAVVAGVAMLLGLLLVVFAFWWPARHHTASEFRFTRAFSLWHVFAGGGVMIAIIALVETVFAYSVLLNFRALDPNSVALLVVQEVQRAAAACSE
jgi:fumarate reductase subunit D